MDFIPSTNNLIISNYQKIIIADIYTLKSLSSISMTSIMHVKMIPESNFAVITKYDSMIVIIDTIKG